MKYKYIILLLLLPILAGAHITTISNIGNDYGEYYNNRYYLFDSNDYISFGLPSTDIEYYDGIERTIATTDASGFLVYDSLSVTKQFANAWVKSGDDYVHWWKCSEGSGAISIDSVDPSYGDNLVVNGDFSSSSGWSIPTGVISGGVATFTNDTAGVYRSDTPLIAGHKYQIIYKVNSIASGSITVRVALGASFFGTIRDSADTYTEYFTHSGTNSRVGLRPITPFTGVVDFLTIQEVFEPINGTIVNADTTYGGSFHNKFIVPSLRIDNLQNLKLEVSSGVSQDLYLPITLPFSL